MNHCEHDECGIGTVLGDNHCHLLYRSILVSNCTEHPTATIMYYYLNCLLLTSFYL